MKKKFANDVKSENSDVKSRQFDKKSKPVKGSGKHWDKSNDMEKPYVGPNDINWRNKAALLVKSAANIPFGQPLGLTYDRLITKEAVPVVVANNAIPGVMGVATMLTAGSAKDYNSPVNLAARKSYSYIRHANSGSKNYENTDLCIYYVSYAQALALLGYLRRIYVYSMRYSTTNRYLPLAILKMNLVDGSDIVKHLPDLAFLINWATMALNSLAVPKMPYFDMCLEHYQYVYRDSESPKEQFYLFVPSKFGVYNPTFTTNGGGIDYTQSNASFVGSTLKTFDDLYALTHAVLDVLLGDEDIGIISGDILKAYGDNRFIIPATDIGKVADPIYSLEVLEQIHNCSTTARTLEGYEQDPGSTGTAPFLKEKWTAQSYSLASGDTTLPVFGGQMLDAFSKEPTPDEVVNCSVLKVMQDFTASGSTAGSTVTLGDTFHECILPSRIYYIKGASNSRVTVTFSNYLCWAVNIENMAGANSKKAMFELSIMSSFDWAPIVLIKAQDEGQNSSFIEHGDIHNATQISSENLKRIHEASVLSLFNFVE